MTNTKNFWNNKKVFLTGHTGFKGTWFTTWLLNLGANVCGYSLEAEQNSLFRYINNMNNNNKTQKFKSITANLKDRDILYSSIKNFQPEIVFHFAAQPLVRKSYIDPIETWESNLMGSLYLLEALRQIKHKCAVVVITTDKVYKNKKISSGYSENDQLGGYDPYSASKACLEYAVESWRLSFVGEESYQNRFLSIATARAGNVIGGGDWAVDRIIPDAINSIVKEELLNIRNPNAVRPWQHVLDPLGGYLALAEKLYTDQGKRFCEAFNFGPTSESNKSVKQLIENVFEKWEGKYLINKELVEFHETQLLSLNIEKAYNLLNWKPKWDFDKTIEKTVNWYKNFYQGKCPLSLCKEDLEEFTNIKIK